jgi:CHAD domain-containing protein
VTGTTAAPELGRASAAGDVLLAHVEEQVRRIRALDGPVRLDTADAVHKMRVATRRLRSALATFAPLVRADVVRPLGGELRWLAAELGAVRDAEVLRMRVQAAVEAGAGGGVEAPGAAGIADAELGALHRAAHDRLLVVLDGERYRALLAALDDLVASPPLTELAAESAGTSLPRLVARSFERVRRVVRAADRTADDAEREELMHDARKAAKRARYAAETVDPVFGADAVAFAGAMEAVQEALGEHQDSVLAQERLRDLARHTPSTEAAFLYGRLHALEEVQAARSREHVDAAWKAARRSALHEWLR